MPTLHQSLRRIIVALLALGCTGSEPRAESLTIFAIGDTTIARSRPPGAWGDGVTLVEELRIGMVDGPPEYTFAEPREIEVDEDGNIYVLDSGIGTVRVYDSTGKHLRNVGSKGNGPGELSDAMGMVLTRDGRLIVRNYGNGRITVYARDGTFIENWSLPARFATSDPVLIDDANNVYTKIIAERTPEGNSRFGLMRYDSMGNVTDTIRGPYDEYETRQIVITNGSAITVYRVPFAPGAYWTLDGEGRILGGIGDRYAIDRRSHDGKVFRIEHDSPPTPVQADERAVREEMLRRNAVRTLPGWKWSGPRSPDVKPAILGISVASDGQIWVQVPQPGKRSPPDANSPPSESGLPALDTWTEAVAFDVFEPDGRYLGRLHAPQRFTRRFSRGNYVWGLAWDENDLGFVVRLRIVPAS